jgi:hypothetical protein
VLRAIAEKQKPSKSDTIFATRSFLPVNILHLRAQACFLEPDKMTKPIRRLIAGLHRLQGPMFTVKEPAYI